MAATTIDLQSASGIDGKFLADGQGRAMYLFEEDKDSTSERACRLPRRTAGGAG